MTTNEATVLFNNAVLGYARFNSLKNDKKEIMNFIETEINDYKNKQSLTPALIGHVEKLVEFYTACKTLLEDQEREQHELKNQLQKVFDKFQQIKVQK